MCVVIVGGGWAGCAAAFSANAAGAAAILVEKTDMLLGTGLVGGIMRNNGRFTALEEIWAMGGGEFLKVIEEIVTHRGVNFPGHLHAMLYDVTRIEPAIRSLLLSKGVELKLQKRMTGVSKSGDVITGLLTADGEKIGGGVYIDCTGTAGPAGNCARYGAGCAMCVLRCPTFGPRVSLTDRAGVAEIRAGEGFPHFEAMSGSCKLEKKSIRPDLVQKLESEGVLVVPLPAHLHKSGQLQKKACQQYALNDFAENLVILDTGHAKLMAPCDAGLRVSGAQNLFCAGEKTGLLVGHTEAIATGFLAGHNAVRLLNGHEPLALPGKLACGDIISFMHNEMKKTEGLGKKYTFSGSVYFDRMRKLGLYTTDIAKIKERVDKTGLTNIFTKTVSRGRFVRHEGRII